MKRTQQFVDVILRRRGSLSNRGFPIQIEVTCMSLRLNFKTYITSEGTISSLRGGHPIMLYYTLGAPLIISGRTSEVFKLQTLCYDIENSKLTLHLEDRNGTPTQVYDVIASVPV